MMLTLYERTTLILHVLSKGRGVRDMILAAEMRDMLAPTDEEIKKFGMQNPAVGVWMWSNDAGAAMKAEGTGREFDLTEPQQDYIRDCIELMHRQREREATPAWVALVQKFFDLQELADRIEPQDENKSQSERKG